MLSPKRVKWRKQHRLRIRGYASRGTKINFGDFALVASQPGQLTSRQIEAGRIAISRSVKRGGKMWIRIFPDRPITKKPAETRMGKGKGSLEHWVANVEAGRILFEINGVTSEQAKEAFRLASHKFPVKTKFLARES